MPKFMYVLWKPADMPSEDFQRSLIEEKGPALLDHGVDQLAINLTDIAPSAVERPREDGSSVNALVSIELASKAEAQAIAEILDPTGRGIAGYEVEEAIPVDYDRDWPDGERSPGAKQVTLLRRKPGLSDEAFFHHWIDVHAPLAIEVRRTETGWHWKAKRPPGAERLNVGFRSAGWFTPSRVGTPSSFNGFTPSRHATLNPYWEGLERRW